MTAEATATPAGIPAQRTRIAVVIPTYGREQILIDTIRMVLAQYPPADEVLIVDQSEDHEPDTVEFLSEHDRDGSIRWIRQSPPNLPAARNRGLRETDCEVVLFLDDDVILDDGLIGFHQSNYTLPHVEAVTGRLNGRRPRRKPPVGVIPQRHLEFRYFDFDSPARRESVAALCGGNHSIRRATTLEMGGYDENYLGWAFREETDLALRLLRGGKQIVFDPRAGLLHLAAPSGGCRLSGFQQMLRQWTVSFPAHYFCWKHLFPSRCFWQELGESFRRSVLSRHNVLAPYRLAPALISFAFSLVYSWWRWRQCK